MRHIDRLADYSDEVILAELRAVADRLGKRTLVEADIHRDARCSYGLLKKRFGGLRAALEKAGLDSPPLNRNVSDDELFLELQRVWDEVLENEGRRPYTTDLRKYGAKYSRDLYCVRWGSWIRACEALMEWEEALSDSRYACEEQEQGCLGSESPRQKRPIGLRKRYEILKRDGFKCVVCGRSPATHPGVLLHIDHMIPESKGGPAELGNLRTLCAECNIGKADILP